MYPVLLGLSFVSAPLTLALHGVMAIYYVFNQVPVPTVDGRQPDPIALELDRGTEEQKRWRGKVAALAAWADGPYRQVFGVQTLTIAVVTLDEARQDTLRRWISQELTRRGQQQLAEIFLFTSADPVTIAPAQFFLGPCCYEPPATEPVSLVLPPAPPKPAVQVLPLPQRCGRPRDKAALGYTTPSLPLRAALAGGQGPCKGKNKQDAPVPQADQWILATVATWHLL